MKYQSYFVILLLSIQLATISCKKFVIIEPIDEIESHRLFSDSLGAESAVIGLYANFMSSFAIFNGYLSRYGGLYADELTKTTSSNLDDNNFQQVRLAANNTIIAEIWASAYNYIYQANDILRNLDQSHGLSQTMMTRLAGEAKFLRALTYFYLVNLFGDVPLVLETNPKQTFNMPRTQEAAVYQQISADLRGAVVALPLEYLPAPTAPSNRIRANKAAAAALLARVSLYLGDYANAITYCSWVIDCGIYQLEPTLNNVFLATSRETLLAFFPTSSLYNTAEGRIFGYNPATPRPSFQIATSLRQSFTSNDQRLSAWIRTVVINNVTYVIPDKYKIFESSQVIEYNVALRLAELYLIRAEANIFTGRYAEATTDLDTIRHRAGLPNLPFNMNQNALLQTLEQENQHEYFTEWGHRWFDLRRWPDFMQPNVNATRADDILTTFKPGLWQPYKRYWPLPGEELLKSSTLSQNPGY